MIPRLFNRATPRRPLPGGLDPVRMSRAERSRVHMLASLLLDYPDDAWFARLDELESHLVRVPPQIAGLFAGFIDAARQAGAGRLQRDYVDWDFDAEELPDYLPAVLEFSARSEDEIAEVLLAAHVEGIEVLRAALEATDSLWAPLVRTITLSLPPVDAATRERVLALVSEGPPTETVGLSFLGNLPPFSPRGNP